ncbi:MAG: Zn-ribbon domain-containing OB-fold protein [Chloroflexi bacterium]|nr:Zn-ribbon domain-containing OB-fold protein [Chloroflexota bacterium]
MAESEVPLPVPDERSKPFFEGAKRHELVLQKCKSCGAVLWPVKFRCDSCLNTELEWAKVSGKGKLYTFAIMHQVFHPGFADKVPYNIAVVELDEGLRVTTNVVGCSNSELRADMPLEVTFEDLSEKVTIPKFKPAE